MLEESDVMDNSEDVIIDEIEFQDQLDAVKKALDALPDLYKYLSLWETSQIVYYRFLQVRHNHG